MDNADAKFWTGFWGLFSIVAIVLIAVSGFNIYHDNIQRDGFRTACISKGNQYIMNNCVVGIR